MLKRVLIFGRASGVWDEVAAAQEISTYDYTLAVGSVGVDYPHLFDGWVSFHSDLFAHWVECRQRKGYPLPFRYWSSKKAGLRTQTEGYPLVERVPCNGGSSGRIAVIVALNKYKADRVVLAGIPMDIERGQYDTKKPWTEALKHRGCWFQDLPNMIGRVRSMSGWTKELLGGEPPDEYWLNGLQHAA